MENNHTGGSIPYDDDRALLRLARAYRLYEKIAPYPRLMDEFRSLLREMLERKGSAIPSPRELRNGAGAEAGAMQQTLIDLACADACNEEEIDGIVNQVRKQDKLCRLEKVVANEGARPQEVREALKEYCAFSVKLPGPADADAEAIRVALLRRFISEEISFIGVAKKYFTIRDIGEILKHSLWNPRQPGRVGGKAAGLLLAQRILLPDESEAGEAEPDLRKYVRAPESFFVSSGFFSDFLDYNDMYDLHNLKYKPPELIEEEYEKARIRFQRATVPPDVRTMFRTLLESIGTHPLVLRSSALLEDSFEYAFSGKYVSVFIPNQGSIEERVNAFLEGLKRVFLSTFGPSALSYRRQRNLIDTDERMSVLVEKVVGKRFGDFFFPTAAGVAFSHNAYLWTPRIKPEDGLVRLVFGLGTRAVGRVSRDYPRMVALSDPLLRPEADAARIARFSQRMVDVLDLNSGEVRSIPAQELFGSVEHPDLFYVASVQSDGDLTAPLFKTQDVAPDRSYITFDNFLSKTPFAALMRKLLKKLENGFGRTVDVEFAWDDDVLHLLQCRTIPLIRERENVALPDRVPVEHTIFSNNRGVSMGSVRDIEYVIYVDPTAYQGIVSYEEKLDVGKAVGHINRVLAGKRMALFGPGRWGSNDVNLGVRVGYEDINHCSVLAEIAFRQEEGTPEVSYGTHFFNDLVEGEILYVALFPDNPGTTFRHGFFRESANSLPVLAPEWSKFEEVVRVIHVPSVAKEKFLQVYQDGHEQRGIGFLAGTDEHFPALCTV